MFFIILDLTPNTLMKCVDLVFKSILFTTYYGFSGEKLMKKMKQLLSLALILAIAPNTLFASPTDLGYRFAHKTNIVFRNLAPTYNDAYTPAAVDYGTAGFTFVAGPSHLDPPYSKNVAFHEANWGWTTLRALSLAYNSNGDICITESGVWTGHCNKTTKKADFGYIKINNAYTGISAFPNPPTLANKNFLIRHEFGHTLGLGHAVVCNNANTIMVPAVNCSPLYTTLQTSDFTVLGAWYP